jgi:hypothetical protein
MATAARGAGRADHVVVLVFGGGTSRSATAALTFAMAMGIRASSGTLRPIDLQVAEHVAKVVEAPPGRIRRFDRHQSTVARSPGRVNQEKQTLSISISGTVLDLRRG